jgi:tetratricopeptide (TPR) repeat protein
LNNLAMLSGLAVLLAATLKTFGQTTAGQAQSAFAQGVELQQKGDLEDARRAYQAALKLDPQRIDALSNLGLVYSQLGQQELAVRCFRDALKVNPRQQAVRFNLGVAYMRSKRYQPAQLELAKVISARPANLAARNLRALCLFKLERLEEGIVELEAVRRANPKDLEVSYTLSSAYIKTGQLDKAAPVIRELENNDSVDAHFIVGSYYLARFHHQRAIREFTVALQRNPRLPEVHAQLGYAYYFDSKPDLSAKMCEEELALYPDDSNATSLLGSIYRERGQLEQAAALLDKANHLRPDDYEILFQMALLAQVKNDYVRTEALLERVTQLKPDFPPAHIVLVRIYKKLQRPEDAKREQLIASQLDAERKNLPTVRDKALYDAFEPPQ